MTIEEKFKILIHLEKITSNIEEIIKMPIALGIENEIILLKLLTCQLKFKKLIEEISIDES